MNFDFSSQKVFNGLLYGTYSMIVKQLESDKPDFDRWIGIYNRSKVNIHRYQDDFLSNCPTKFCFIIFYYQKDSNLEQEGFRNKYFKSIAVEYFDEITDLNQLSEKHDFTLTDFVPSWKVEYPMGW